MAQTNDTFEGLYMQNDRYVNEFEEAEKPIGGGAYGIVFKAKNQIDDKYYAIKKIKVFGKFFLSYEKYLKAYKIPKFHMICFRYFFLKIVDN